MLLDAYERYGPVFTLRVFHGNIVFALGPEANHHILVANAQNFSLARRVDAATSSRCWATGCSRSTASSTAAARKVDAPGLPPRAHRRARTR